MGKLLVFSPREALGNGPPKEREIFSAKVAQLAMKTLPIDRDRFGASDEKTTIFLRKLLEEKVVNIALDEEKLDTESTLRVLGENNVSWEMNLGEFISIMKEQPSSMSDTDLRRYLVEILGRVGVEVLFDAYSPNVTGITELDIDASQFPLLLDAAVVGESNEGIYHFSIRTDQESESLKVHPEAFHNPREIPLFVLVVEYLIRTYNDGRIHYLPEDTVDILRYHQGVMYMIPIPYGRLFEQAMAKVYEYMPHYRAMKNDRVALDLFYRKNIRAFLR